MRLYLVQHGEAKSEAEDPERSLTIRGEGETRKISGAVKKAGYSSFKNLSQRKIGFSPLSRRERGERIFYLAERYRQIKRFLFLKTRLMIGTTTIKRIDLDPSRRDGVSAPIAVSRLEQKKDLLCDLRGSAVKPRVERGEF